MGLYKWLMTIKSQGEPKLCIGILGKTRQIKCELFQFIVVWMFLSLLFAKLLQQWNWWGYETFAAIQTLSMCWSIKTQNAFSFSLKSKKRHFPVIGCEKGALPQACKNEQSNKCLWVDRHQSRSTRQWWCKRCCLLASTIRIIVDRCMQQYPTWILKNNDQVIDKQLGTIKDYL